MTKWIKFIHGTNSRYNRREDLRVEGIFPKCCVSHFKKNQL